MNDKFTKIYKTNIWNCEESISGTGSTIEITKAIRYAIPILIDKYKINTFLDIPCGDFNWMKDIIDTIPNYIGADIVYDLIEKNRKKYPENRFEHLDILKDPLPENIDLIFCRDLLVHFRLSDINTFLKIIKKSNIKYLLMTTFINRKFRDIKTHRIRGDWRPISFFNEPFNFPKPLELINEISTELYPKNIDKCLGLWRISDLV